MGSSGPRTAALTPAEKSARARVIVLARQDPTDPVRLARARRDLVAAQLVAYVERVMVHDPPLTRAQLARVRAVLRGGPSSTP